MYYKVKTSWRAWLKIASLKLQDSSILKRVKTSKRAPNIIVSLTTIPTRLVAVEHTLRSIIAGELLPEAVCIYVDEKTYKIIKSESAFIERLIELEFVRMFEVEDVRSYKKFIFSVLDYPDKDIVICDDDVLYPKYWLSALLAAQAKYDSANTIICHRAHQVIFEESGEISPYKLWPKEVSTDNAASILFPTGTGGILYPAHAMPPLTYDKSAFSQVAPTADDVWFWLCAISVGCNFKVTDIPFKHTDFLEIPDSQVVNLWSINVNQSANDTQLMKSLNFFWSRDLLKADTPIIDLLNSARKFIKQ